MRVLFDTSPAEFYPGGISVYTQQLAQGRHDRSNWLLVLTGAHFNK